MLRDARGQQVLAAPRSLATTPRLECVLYLLYNQRRRASIASGGWELREDAAAPYSHPGVASSRVLLPQRDCLGGSRCLQSPQRQSWAGNRQRWVMPRWHPAPLYPLCPLPSAHPSSALHPRSEISTCQGEANPSGVPTFASTTVLVSAESRSVAQPALHQLPSVAPRGRAGDGNDFASAGGSAGSRSLHRAPHLPCPSWGLERARQKKIIKKNEGRERGS